MNVAGTRRMEFGNLVIRANMCALTRGARILSPAVSSFGRMRKFSCDSATLCCAAIDVETLPSRLR